MLDVPNSMSHVENLVFVQLVRNKDPELTVHVGQIWAFGSRLDPQIRGIQFKTHSNTAD